MDIYKEIERLLNFGLQKNLIEKEDIIYTRNLLFDLLEVSPMYYECNLSENLETSTAILDNIFKYATEKGLCEDTITEYDLFTTKVMGVLTPRPSYVVKEFTRLYTIDKKKATDYFYSLSKDSNYIMVDRVKQNLEWDYASTYGDLKITINVSKPEKDPKDIAKAKLLKTTGYPNCLLCVDNVGFKGHINHPARQNLRVIPVTLNNESWSMQYSPYVYYNEHCIVFNNEHTPMTGSSISYVRLLDFVDFLPHYFIGSNAGLPIVGGSILSHDHFQGGSYDMPMAKATDKIHFTSDKFKSLKISIVDWQMSVVRVRSKNKEEVQSFSVYLHDFWQNYDCSDANILSHTGETPHNAITPICRKNSDDEYEMDLVLRNNLTSEEHPFGIFHPHNDIHHIKKENIGLIEVMGLAVLPKRLVEELEDVKSFLVSDKKDLNSFKDNIHYDWTIELIEKYGRSNDMTKATKIVEDGVGKKFERCLIDAGVFKNTLEGTKYFKDFLIALGLKEA